MGVRARKSIRIGPFAKVNLNKSSVGVTLGTRGAHVSINTKGQRTTSIGIPGSGISYVSTEGGTKESENLLPSEAKVPFYLNWFFILILCLTGYGVLLAIPLALLRLKINKKKARF